MDIVIVAQYILDITTNESLNSRFIYLADMLKEDNSVEVVTTDFIHARKCNVKPITDFNGIKIKMLHEPGYKKNISLKRFYSHAILAKNVKDYLNKRKKPDVIYCAVPSLDVAAAVSKYCKSNNVRFIIDIQDLWPEAFKMVFNIPIISDLLFLPLELRANNIYKSASSIVSVSNTYAIRAKKNNTTATSLVAYLGTERETFDKNLSSKKEIDKFEIVYIGSLEKSYDITTIIKALATIDHVRLIIIGEGSQKKEFQALAHKYKIDCEFCGYMPYDKMISKMSKCHIAVNPIKKGSAGSVLNKVGDYAMAGLPVVNTQECEEYRNLLNEYNAGINCKSEDDSDVAYAINYLIKNPKVYLDMCNNARLLGEEKFDRKITYGEICKLIYSGGEYEGKYEYKKCNN